MKRPCPERSFCSEVFPEKAKYGKTDARRSRKSSTGRPRVNFTNPLAQSTNVISQHTLFGVKGAIHFHYQN